MQEFLLVVSVWIHLSAAVVWIGGICFVLYVALPGAKETTEEPGKIMGALSKRFVPLANISILLIFATGILMSLSYRSLSEIAAHDTSWSQGLSVKISLALIMAGIHLYRGLVLAPSITKLSAEGGKSKKIGGLQELSLNLVKVNFLLGLTVLLTTAILFAYRS